jgi:hypothetical protein
MTLTDRLVPVVIFLYCLAALVAARASADSDLSAPVRSAGASTAADRCNDGGCRIAYLPIADRPPVPPVCRDVLVNGDFEQGRGVGWSEESTVRSAIVRKTRPRNGSWSAWLGGHDLAVDVLEQTEMLVHWPPDAGLRGDLISAELSFSWRVHSAEDPYFPADMMSVSLSNPDGVDLVEVVRLSSANERRVWRTYRTDVTYALQRLDNRHRSRLTFRAVTDHSHYTSWFIDDVQLRVCVRGADERLPTPTLPPEHPTETPTVPQTLPPAP